MALSMMIPGMFAGWLQEKLGYNNFFIWVMICSIVPIIAVSLLKINPDYGRKKRINCLNTTQHRPAKTFILPGDALL
jgi:hypothetical protein